MSLYVRNNISFSITQLLVVTLIQKKKKSINQAGHSVGVRPSPIPNLEVKPNVAVVLLRCESSWEVAVLAFYILEIKIAEKLILLNNKYSAILETTWLN